MTKWRESKLPLHTLKMIVGHTSDLKKIGVLYEESEGATETYVHIDRVSGEVLKARLQQMKQGMDNLDFGIDLSGISYERFLARK